MGLNNERKSYYLKAMGIVQWQDREVIKTVNPPLHVVEVFRNEQWRGVFLLELSDENLKNHANEIKLLSEIAKAIGVNMKNEKPILLQDYSFQNPIACFFIFGKHLSLPNTMEASKQITTHALSELLNRPALKKETWKDLSG